MNLKNILLLSFALCLIPGGASATVPDTKAEQQEKIDKGRQEMHRGHHHMMYKDWQAKMQEREEKLLTWVSEYTPDQKEEWQEVLKEKKELRNKWMSPENAKKREQWKKEKMAKMNQLKKQYDEGKITKEEFLKKAHGGKNMSHWKTYHELEEAVKNKDKPKAVELLNKMLEQSKEHNDQLEDMLEE